MFGTKPASGCDLFTYTCVIIPQEPCGKNHSLVPTIKIERRRRFCHSPLQRHQHQVTQPTGSGIILFPGPFAPDPGPGSPGFLQPFIGLRPGGPLSYGVPFRPACESYACSGGSTLPQGSFCFWARLSLTKLVLPLFLGATAPTSCSSGVPSFGQFSTTAFSRHLAGGRWAALFLGQLSPLSGSDSRSLLWAQVPSQAYLGFS